jgi:hypothetical protein
MTEPVNLYQRRCERLANTLQARLLRAEIAHAVDAYAAYFELHGLTVHISWARDTAPPDDSGNVVLHFDWDKARLSGSGSDDGGGVA